METYCKDIDVAIGPMLLPGFLSIPNPAQGLVLFAHGSGSSRFSVRNQMVANELFDAGIATVLFDLLQESEQEDRRYSFDIELLSRRLVDATIWAHYQSRLLDLPVGYFGSSTGAAGALLAAIRSPVKISGIVSRGGRPDLVRNHLLSQVQAPTLLIVGSKDEPVDGLNRQALRIMSCERRLRIIPGAGHLFSEPGAMEEVSSLATEWFAEHFSASTWAHTGPVESY